jgi:drug/metabolite transporter (DMT)-like permease
VIAHPGIVLAVAAAVVYNLGFILEKRALARLPAIDAHHVWRLVRTLFSAPAWLAGFALICGGLVLQVLVLSLEPLTVAQPLQACGVVVTIALSRLVLHERLGRTELACIGVIAVAVLLLGLSVGHSAGAGVHAAGIAIAAAAAPACLAGLLIYGWVHRASSRRHRFPVSGISYGLCAGLMYGVAGLALKALSAAIFTGQAAPHAPAAALASHIVTAGAAAAVPHHPAAGLLIAAVLSPYLYAVLACSAAGMCLFQTALQRSPASIILPMSNIISTAYLVVVGSWLFHERLPAGLAPLAMRLAGGVAAVAVPVILTVAAERATSRRRAGYRRHHRHRHRPALPLSTERPLP